MISKDVLRSQIKEKIRQTPPKSQSDQSQHIVSLLLPLIKQYNTWAVYIPLDWEPNLSDWYEILWNQHITTVIPYRDLDGKYCWYYYTKDDCLYKKDWYFHLVYGQQYYDKVDSILVPWLAFDHRGVRLGRWWWWYDRLLVQYPHVYKIGICFDVSYVDILPCVWHDVKMDQVVVWSCAI